MRALASVALVGGGVALAAFDPFPGAWLVLAIAFGVAGFVIGTWWAVWLVPAAVLIAVPFGTPQSDGSEPLPTFLSLMALSPLLFALTGAGIWVRKRRDRRRRGAVEPAGEPPS